MLKCLTSQGPPSSIRTGVDCIVPSRPVRGSWQSLRRALPGPWTVANTGCDFRGEIEGAINDDVFGIGEERSLSYLTVNGWVVMGTIRSWVLLDHARPSSSILEHSQSYPITLLMLVIGCCDELI